MCKQVLDKQRSSYAASMLLPDGTLSNKVDPQNVPLQQARLLATDSVLQRVSSFSRASRTKRRQSAKDSDLGYGMFHQVAS